MTPLCCPIGHAAGTASVVAHDGWTLAPWPSSLPSELRITRVFPCVARELKARASFMFAGGCRWRSLAVDGSSGASRGHAPVVRRPGSRWGGAVERPSAFQAGHIPSLRGSCECHALSLVADVSGWPLLLLSPLLSAAGPGPHLQALPGAVTAPCPPQAPPPNPIAAEPDGGRVLSRGGVADHEVTPQAPLTGSGCREYSCGGFGGGHPHFLPHSPDLLIRRSMPHVQPVRQNPYQVSIHWMSRLSALVRCRPVSL